MFIKELKTSFLMLVVMSAITGVAYPIAVRVVARAAFPRQAEGSFIVKDGKAIGSRLIGQPFDDPKYFWGRLSATTPAYNAASSSGSNLGPTNPALMDEVNGRIKALRDAEKAAIEIGGKAYKWTKRQKEAAVKEALAEPIPVDLVTSSGSGLDPDISPAAALYQSRRVSLARGIPENEIRKLIASATTGRSLGFMGEPTVNVLKLNLSLDGLAKH